MPFRNLARAEWKPYFDRISRELVVTPVTVQVRIEAPELGNVIQDQGLKCRGLVYSDRDESFEVHSDRHSHRVHQPGEIRVDERRNALQRLEVIDAEGRHHVVELERPITGSEG
jgi:hypothetical protein